MKRFVSVLCIWLTIAGQGWAAYPLKQSTSATVKLGPFVDDADFSAETSLTIQKADVRLSKNGGNMAAANADQGSSDAGAPHDELGQYDISLDATDTGTLGTLKIMVAEAGTLQVWLNCEVLPANVYDSLYSTDKLQVDATQVEGSDATDYIEGAIAAVLAAYKALKADTPYDVTTANGTVQTEFVTPAP